MDAEMATVVGKYIGAALACAMFLTLAYLPMILVLRWLKSPAFLIPWCRIALPLHMLGFFSIAFFIALFVILL